MTTYPLHGNFPFISIAFQSYTEGNSTFPVCNSVVSINKQLMLKDYAENGPNSGCWMDQWMTVKDGNVEIYVN